ncbi:MAG: formate/nitrite transporter family protein [Lachnospiraceae bacterium]
MSIREALDKYAENCRSKVTMPTVDLVGKAIFAGLMIGMGAAASSVAAHSVSNVGLARLTAAAVFPVGLMMVILLGAELFTGDCLMAMGVSGKQISLKECLRALICVYLGNLAGATLLAVMVSFSGQWDYSNGLLGAYTIKLALGKATLSFGKALMSGILCNILVCGAVLMAICAKDVTGKLLASFFVIMLFVTAGFEHCVANMYYITAGLLAKGNADYVAIAMEQYGISEAQMAMLNIKNYLVANLLPVSLGNILGGIVFMGLPLWYTNHYKPIPQKK